MRDRRTELAVAGLVFASVVLIELGSDISPELWWQLASGDILLTDGFPESDPLSWSSSDRSWQVHGWLSHALLAGLASWLGIAWLPVLFAAALGIAWTVLYVAAPGNPFGRAALTLLAAFAASPLTSADSRTISIVMFGLTVAIAELVARGRWPRAAAWSLAPLLVLWANLDTWYLPGVVYLLGRAISVRLAKTRDDTTSDRLGAVLIAGIVGFVATLINPYMVDGVTASAVRAVGGPRSLIADLQSPDFQLAPVWPWIVLVGVIVLVAAFKPRLSLSELLVFFGFLALAMTSYQYVALHAVVAVPVGAAAIAVGRSERAPASLVGASALAVAALAWVIAPSMIDRWESRQPDTYPVAAVGFLEDSAVEGKVFNELFWGGYLANQQIRTFSDTRYGFHPADFVRSAVDSMNALPAWRQVDEEYGPTVVLIRADRGLGALLAKSEEWTEAYADDVARVFLRGDS